MIDPGAKGGHEGAILRLLDRPVSDADLAAETRLAAADVSRSSRSAGLLLFGLGAELTALPARLMQRVTPAARPSPIPHRTSGVLRGLCNIRGELVLCADLHRLLGLPPRAEPPPPGAPDPRRMVVVGPVGDAWAFEVDRLVGVEQFDPNALKPPPVTVELAIGAFTAGLAEIDGRTVTVLDGGRVLAGFKAGLA